MSPDALCSVCHRAHPAETLDALARCSTCLHDLGVADLIPPGGCILNPRGSKAHPVPHHRHLGGGVRRALLAQRPARTSDQHLDRRPLPANLDRFHSVGSDTQRRSEVQRRHQLHFAAVSANHRQCSLPTVTRECHYTEQFPIG